MGISVLIVLGSLTQLLIGPHGFGWPDDPFIAWQLRVPRLLLALGAGAGLAGDLDFRPDCLRGTWTST